MTNFYQSREWRELRFKVLANNKRQCMCCRATDRVLHVDHIRPISKFPELKLDINNLQILCEDCNLGKSNIFFNDFRMTKKQRKKLEREYFEPFNIESIIGKKGFLAIRKSKVFHLWNGFDTVCRMYSSCGLRVTERSIFTESIKDGEKICLNCRMNL